MANISEMRQELYSRYPGKMWKKKVSKMPDTQVIAVYRSMQERKQREEMKQQQPRLFPE